MKLRLSVLTALSVLAITGSSQAVPSLVHVTEGKGKVVCVDGSECAVKRYQVILAVTHPGRSFMTLSEGLLAPTVVNVGCVGVYPTKWGHNVVVTGSASGTFVWLFLSDHKTGNDYAAVGRHPRPGGVCDAPFGDEVKTLDLKGVPPYVVKPGSYTTKP